MVRAWASREIFFQGDKVGEPITPLETQLRIKLMMHDRSQLSGCVLSGFLSYTLSLSIYIYIYIECSNVVM